MKLDQKTRHQIMAGKHPKIAGKGTCPIEAPAVVELTARVSIRVDRIRIPRGGGWSLQYTVIDFRDSFLAPSNRKVDLDEKGRAKPMSPAEEHGLTSNPRDPLDAGVYVGPVYQTVVDMRGRLKRAERPVADTELDAQVRSFKEQLRTVLLELDPAARAAMLARLDRAMAAKLAVEEAA